MKTLRRYNLADHDYFLTIVTYNREPLLLYNPGLFWESWSTLRPYAWVLTPDHLHVMLNSGIESISKVVHGFKVKYASKFRMNFRDGRVWQNRFWDHVIRDQDDMNNHLDYIHYNPVKHKLASSAIEWQHSSFAKYVSDGLYRPDWGQIDPPIFEGEYGE